MKLYKTLVFKRYLKNYYNLKSKHSFDSLYFLILKILFEKFITSILQSLNFNKLLVHLIKKYNLIYSIKSVSIQNKILLEKTWSKYNQINEVSVENKKIIDELNKKGYSYLGKIFSNEECEEFKHSLKGKYFFNSQQPLQSDGKKYLYNADIKEHDFSYACFLPSDFINFNSLQIFLDKNKKLFREYLRFEPQIYSSLTWINSQSKEDHYVHKLHRDYDDYKFLTIIVNWTRSSKENGATRYLEGTHKSNINHGNEVYFDGDEGSVYIANLYGLHSGTPVKGNNRISTWIRLGHLINPGSLQDGLVTAP